MSRIQDDRATGLSDIFLREIKDKIDPAWRLQRQLERCNILAAQATDEYHLEAFKNSVDMTMGDLPQHIKAAVEKREEEYLIAPQAQLRFMSRGGIRIGTIENPVTDDDGTVISPVVVEPTPEDADTDYVKKLEVIKEELESGGASWSYRKALKEDGKVPNKLAANLVADIERVAVNTILRHRRDGHRYSYREYLNTLRKLTPRLPIFKTKEEYDRAIEANQLERTSDESD